MGCIAIVAGCRDSDPPPSDDPAVTAPSTSIVETSLPAPTTTALIPLDQDPPVIDLAYAQRVLDEISRLDGEASRILHRARAMTPEFEMITDAYLHGEALEGARTAAKNDLSIGLRNYRDPPGDPLVIARSIAKSRVGCIALLADSDFRPRYRDPVPEQKGIGIVLQRNLEPTEQEHRLNPTNWVQTLGGTIAQGRNIGEACP